MSGRRQQQTVTDGDGNGRRQWMETAMATDCNGRQRLRTEPTMEMEGDDGRRQQWQRTAMDGDDDGNGRRWKWMEMIYGDDGDGGRRQWTATMDGAGCRSEGDGR